MRTERAPTTAVSGKNKSEDALAISTAILAAPYAVFHADSPDDPGSLIGVSMGSEDGEAIDRAIALDEAASNLVSLARACFMYFMTGNVGVGGGLSVGVTADEDFFRK